MNNRKPHRASDLSTRRLSDDETVVLSPKGSAVVLNEVGAVVLELCDGTRTVDEVADVLCENLRGASPEQVRADVRSFVETLTASGCLVDGP